MFPERLALGVALVLAACAGDSFAVAERDHDAALGHDAALASEEEQRAGASAGRGLIVQPIADAPSRSDASLANPDAGQLPLGAPAGAAASAEVATVDASDAEAVSEVADASSDASAVDAADAASEGPIVALEDLPYVAAVTAFGPGDNAGFGQDDYPEVVLGPPMGGGRSAGSLDVLSLGVGGEIVVDFGPLTIVDGEGPDFIVFENAFWPGGDASQVFKELAEVSVSQDTESWHTFPCVPQGDGQGRYPGCAGWTPTEAYDPLAVYPLDPAQTGGDAFDLAELGLTEARFVRIRDLSSSGQGQNAGFDLDAVGLIHFAP